MAFSPLAGLGGGMSESAQKPSSSVIELVHQAIFTLRDAEDASDADANDIATISTCIANLRKLHAGREKERDAAMGTTPALKFVGRHATSGGGAGY